MAAIQHSNLRRFWRNDNHKVVVEEEEAQCPKKCQKVAIKVGQASEAKNNEQAQSSMCTKLKVNRALKLLD